MSEKEIQIPPLSLSFQTDEKGRKIRIPKSATKIDFKEQIDLITPASPYFVPLTVKEEDDAFLFFFTVESKDNIFQDIKKMRKNDKLRALCNLSHLEPLLSSRITFFLHPNNIIFDDSLMPKIIYRGIRHLLTPESMNEADMIKQLQCFSIALFSNTYSFDDLYQGSLEKAGTTEFERQIKAASSLEELFHLFNQHYEQAQRETEKQMTLVSKGRFKLYKHMTIWLSVAGALLLSLVIYTALFKVPFEERLLEAHHDFLAGDYTEVISVLQQDDVEKLPYHAKYILAYAYLKVEPLSDSEKDAIMKNISLKSDNRYLKYWIFNGKGDFDQSIDLAKYLDDPQLIIYGLIKKTEQVKNDPEITGEEREEEIKHLRDELEKYTEEYDLMEEEENEAETSEEPDVEAATEDAADDDDEKLEKAAPETKQKDKKDK